MKTNQRNSKSYSSQTMKVSKSLTKFLADLGTLSMTGQKRILSVLRSRRQPEEVVEEVEAEADGPEIITPTDKSWTYLHQILKQAQEVEDVVVEEEAAK